ncbi:MAG: asparagine synthase [Crocinitomicaceae bacterium]|nr:asparagine synthase [Crocinitomicaceae bacterium]
MEKVNTFTIGFTGSDFNETHEAKLLAERYGTTHQSILIDDSISNIVPTILDEMGEPLADSSLIPSYLVCREMSKHYKVALSGDGGDELFGYNNYNYAFNLEQLKQLNPVKRKTLIYLSKFLYRFGAATNLGIYEGDLRLLKTEKLVRRNMLFSEQNLKKITNGKLGTYTDYHISQMMAGIEGSIYDKVVYGSLKTRLLCDNLVKMDRSSMMNSLEVRSPFLDKALAEFAFSIPGDLVYKNGITKFVLKELAKKYIAPNIQNRKK